MLIRPIILIFSISLVVGCDDQYNTSSPQVSETSEESLKNSILIGKYSPSFDSIIFNNEEVVVIEEIWIEKTWKYKNTKGDLLPLNGKQLVISSKSDDDFRNYLQDWLFCLPDEKLETGLGNGNIVLNLPDNVKQDTIILDILKLAAPYSISRKSVFRRMVLSRNK
jgi:hypothetical protein